MQTHGHDLQYRPPRIAIGLALLAMLLHWMQPMPLHPNLPVAALMTGTFGAALMLRAWWLFRSASTAICRTDRTTTLITQDVYRFSRNPMYPGMSLMLIALGLLTGATLIYSAALVNAASAFRAL